MALDKVKPLKLESSDTGGTEEDQYPTSLDPSEDYVECAGLVLDDATNQDETTVVWRNSGNMMFKDGANPAGASLTDLLATGGSISTNVDFLLDNDPTSETGAVDCTYTPTYTSGRVTLEEWTRNDATLIKSIDYTYSSGRVSTEVRKVFALNGTTVVGQVTWSYFYTGQILAYATMTRDV